MKTIPVSLPYVTGAVPVSRALLAQFIGDQAIEAGERRFTHSSRLDQSRAHWEELVSVTGLAVEHTPDVGSAQTITLLGDRTINRATALGYALEGKVSVAGVKRRAFTSSQLFELPCGKLVDVAVLVVCKA